METGGVATAWLGPCRLAVGVAIFEARGYYYGRLCSIVVGTTGRNMPGVLRVSEVSDEAG